MGHFFSLYANMTVGTIAKIIEDWAPKELAWEKDNVGLQVGEYSGSVKKILVALEVTDALLDEAEKKKVQLIVSHHPLIFRPLKSVTMNDRVGRLVRRLIQKNIALYSAHTNLDFTKNGVSIALAEQLGLENIEFLVPLSPMHKKVVVFVPRDCVEKVSEAMSNVGAGIIGNYDLCSFRVEGKGTFRGNDKSNPFIGTSKRLESVDEVRLEMLVPKWKLHNVLSAMKSVHPYEEVAFDVYPLENISSDCGMGAIGNLKKEMKLKNFLRHVKTKLGCSNLRYSNGKNETISKVAVCGGSGSEFLSNAIAKNADAYITADVSYHPFHDAENNIVLVDAGHYETEKHILPKIVERLTTEFRNRNDNAEIILAQTRTSAIHWQ